MHRIEVEARRSVFCSNTTHDTMITPAPQAGSTGRAFIDVVEVFKNSGLNFKSMLVRIVDTAQPTTLGELAFHGKYVWKLYRVLQMSALDDETLENVRGEFVHAVECFRDLLRASTDSWPNEQREDVKRRFLHASQESLQQMVMLAEDFFWVKNVELQFKDRLPRA